MNQLNLLSKLEAHHDLLKSYEKELIELESKLKLKDLEKKIKVMEVKLERSKLKRDEARKNLKSYNSVLTEYNFKVEEIEKNLYDGKTTDIKQLEYLNKEKDRLKELVSHKETETLSLMDEIEDIEKEIMEIESFLKEYKIKLVKRRKKFKLFEQKLKEKIEEEKNEISSLENSLDKSLLEKYYSIKNIKGVGISIPQNGVCNRCFMAIATVSLDKLNKGELAFCDNCGRILCKQD